jgi:DNA anti-recombination protein RmuC
VLLLQREIETARTEARLAQAETIGSVRQELQHFSSHMTVQMGQVGTGVARELQHVNQTMGSVQGSLGKLGEVTQRVFDIGKDIAGLEQILRSPKVRGGIGESFLEGLLGQMLPREHYDLQHTFTTGDRVDAIVRIGGSAGAHRRQVSPRELSAAARRDRRGQAARLAAGLRPRRQGPRRRDRQALHPAG